MTAPTADPSDLEPTSGSGVDALPVEVIRSARRKKSVSARVVRGVIEIRMPVGLSPETEQMHIDDLVQKINRKAFARRVDLIARANELAQEYDLPLATDVRWVSNQNSRWGSCTVSHGTIRLSDRMADFPQYVIDFVLLHELTHLVEANHDAAFHALMERFPRAERAEGFLEAAARFR